MPGTTIIGSAWGDVSAVGAFLFLNSRTSRILGSLDFFYAYVIESFFARTADRSRS